MEKSKELGMRTFDMALFELTIEGRITEEEAIKYSDSPNNLRLRFKLYHKGLGSDDTQSAGETMTTSSGLSLSLEPIDDPEDKDL